MVLKSNYFTQHILISRYGWSEDIIAEHLGLPDMVHTFPRDATRRPEIFFLRDRVDAAEARLEVKTIIELRQIELRESAMERADKRKRAMREAVAAVEIVVEVLPLAMVKVKALELFYESLATGRRTAPASIDAAMINDMAMKFALRRLVDYDRIIAGLPVPLKKPDVYRLCRKRIDAAVAAAYPELFPVTPATAEEPAEETKKVPVDEPA